MKGLDRFYAGLTKAFAEILLPETTTEQLSQGLLEFHFGSSDFKPRTSKVSYEAWFVKDVHMGVFEIISSYESLIDAEVYIRRFPYQKTRISKARHLNYVFANHFQELYILKERLKKYLQYTEETYAHGKARKKVKQITQPLFKRNKDFFDQMQSERSKHVHSSRYEDFSITQIESLERLSSNNPDADLSAMIQNIFELRYKIIRKAKSTEIKNRNQLITDFLDEYFETLYPIYFSGSQDLIIPLQK